MTRAFSLCPPNAVFGLCLLSAVCASPSDGDMIASRTADVDGVNRDEATSCQNAR